MKEAKTPKNAIGAPTKSNGNIARVADTFSSSSIGHDDKYAANGKVNGTANNEIHGSKAVRPISPSVSATTPPQNLGSRKQPRQRDAPGPSSAQQDDALNVEVVNTFDAIAGSPDPEALEAPRSSANTAPEDTTERHFSDAHPGTGEPAVEASLVEKSIFFSLNSSPLDKLRSKAKQIPPGTASKGNLSGVDIAEVDGLKIVKNRSSTAIDNNNFEWYIRDKLVAFICTITSEGMERYNKGLEELEMIVNEDDKITPCIVIACASQSRKADVKKKLDSELPKLELYGLPWVVAYDHVGY